jgi:hypothetical protein
MTRFHRDRAAMFDIQKTAALTVLFGTDSNEEGWLERFYDAAWFASLVLASDETFAGPDGMPYLRLELPPENVPFDSQCLANLAGDCLSRGAGAAIFAAPGDPPEAALFVFSFGVLESMLRYDSPRGDPVDLADWARPSTEPKRGFFGFGKAPWEALKATPSADYLPPDVARALHYYMTMRWGLPDPHVSLLIDTHAKPTRNLVIGRKRSSFADQALLDGLIRYTRWYLPPGRGLALMPEDWSESEMTPLSTFFEGS